MTPSWTLSRVTVRYGLRSCRLTQPTPAARLKLCWPRYSLLLHLLSPAENLLAAALVDIHGAQVTQCFVIALVVALSLRVCTVAACCALENTWSSRSKPRSSILTTTSCAGFVVTERCTRSGNCRKTKLTWIVFGTVNRPLGGVKGRRLSSHLCPILLAVTQEPLLPLNVRNGHTKPLESGVPNVLVLPGRSSHQHRERSDCCWRRKDRIAEEHPITIPHSVIRRETLTR